MTTTEMPWVVETRLAPGQKLKRNPAWGIIAIVVAVVNVVAFLAGQWSAPQGDGSLFLIGLPIWGIITLAGLGFGFAAIVKRGVLNVTLGAVGMGVVVLTNPVLTVLRVFTEQGI